ncbi:4-phosphoerythronate dehydrogenase [Reinekea thalattae]|uniref:Erythronate-4-phosphate dehydrogenase n=1 Tax=Reinekea thalattae TaxID=2593301 RepID=A0A5C8Z9R3_9GAMM|nr:4-phosphoerythronate dehydrogenase [Reinekea thalattae]TXR53993.1 4-phosphoerythronate dehydrogenase [Reinekea thalattae]
MRIIADENMPNVEEWFAPVASSIVRKPGRSLTADDLSQADALLVRSVTQVNQALLENTLIRFVGSATIGTDHIDLAYLNSKSIQFHHAPGCNAQSVCDWLLSVFARLYLDRQLDWQHKTIGIVGVGNVGGKVAERLQRLGCKLLLCDPIRYQKGSLPEHVELQELLQQSDIVCLHTPHTTKGDHATHHLFNQQQLNLLRPGCWIINAGRGPVIEGPALAQKIDSGELNAVLDVWPQEPVVTEQQLQQVALASPHVAGYSLEGKFEGTRMLAKAFYQWLGETFVSEQVSVPKAGVVNALQHQHADIDTWISRLVLAVYDPAEDTQALKQALNQGVVSAQAFDALRKNYPTRREIASVVIEQAPAELAQRLRPFGFSV